MHNQITQRNRIIMLVFCGLLASFSLAQTGAEVIFEQAEGAPTLNFDYISGGDVDATSLGNDAEGEACTGWIAEQPDHILIINESLPSLEVSVSSSADTTMVSYAVDAEGNRSGALDCNDDRAQGNINPRLRAAPWEAGRYYIFVGSYERGDFAAYKITFTP